ncbi:hypothetical protein BDZ90DRAFT_228115 [Jaminaea rosea]|uniref:RGS domain-containing protein n=1 Tax=Jaminaea rosea TaxID=1569628 RepID=A0A316URG6_9BASI|nr:hypothetical protein BDZ90DRAFT_228115 [Jaminaea rosea]PWN25725.1 hypothetical protein BDZ90DRAFT_228115 [Jaminaea rosea]
MASGQHRHDELFPCSREGDCTGCTFGPDGRLLIGGLSIDGSAAGEAGWASIDVKPSSHAFQPCLPRDGPSTFGKDVARDSSLTTTTTANDEKDSSIARVASRWTSRLSPRKRDKMSEKAAPLPQLTLADIVEGRTCRPIALVDLRSYLANRREQERGQSSGLDDFFAGIVASQSARDLDAVNFVVSYDRCVRAYRSGEGSIETLRRILVTYVGGSSDEKVATSRASSRSRRLDWMVDLGLLSEDAVRHSLNEAERSSHPSALLPLVNAVSSYIDSHVMPDFMEAASQNLSKRTSRGRLAVGIVATALAILFSVLLAVEPSPLAGGKQHISRWWRVLTFPLWAMGFGYMLAAWTGVCVWLSLRGNRERREEEWATPRPSMEASADEGNLAEVDRSAWFVAPEVRRILPFLPKTLGRTNKDEDATSAPPPAPPAPAPVSASAAPALAAGPAPPLLRPSTSRPLAEPRTSNAAAAAMDGGAGSWTPPSTAPVLVSKKVSVLPGVQVGMRTVQPPVAMSSMSTSTSLPRLSTVTGPSPSHIEKGRTGRRHERIWHTVQRWTGFAVGTERVRDKKVRQIHQWRAFKAVALDGALALIATIVVVAVP